MANIGSFLFDKLYRQLMRWLSPISALFGNLGAAEPSTLRMTDNTSAVGWIHWLGLNMKALAVFLSSLSPSERVASREMTRETKLSTKIYIHTRDSFIKKEYAPSERPKNVRGEPIIWKWGAERLQNEATALALIAKNTTIPVPKVLHCGKDQKGVMYLETELIDGMVCSDAGVECQMPQIHTGSSGSVCLECEKIAFENVNSFIDEVVIPQLRKLKSSQTGLDGIVIPPPRIQEFDKRAEWSPKQALELEYVFCHGDLSRDNILVSYKTLEVKSIIDWECAGFFPKTFELPLWRLDRAGYFQTFREKDKIQQEIALITDCEK